jgi:hypothetical protein
MSSKAGRERRREERLIFKKRYSKIPFFLEKKRGTLLRIFFIFFCVAAFSLKLEIAL